MIYVIERQDGGTSIYNGTDLEAWASVNGEPVSVREVSENEIPTDRTFRDAWTKDLTIDMPKAREIQMAKIRKERDKALAALDIETLKGKDVQAEKQILRDLPQNFDLSVASTPEELKQLWPQELGE